MTDYSKHLITGQAPPGYTAQPSHSGPDSADTGSTRKELIEQWYLEPLEKMSGHEAFVCLAICFLLYEKYLRAVHGLPPDYKFSEGAKVFRYIGEDFGVSEQMAFRFWSDWRNGLLHRGMPKAGGDYIWILTGKQDDVVVEKGNEAWVNPWILRDRIVHKLRQKKEIWRDADSPLMREFKFIDP
jgi:hypothetical protein